MNPKGRLTIQIERLTVQVGAPSDRPLVVELLPQGRGIRVLGDPPQPLVIDAGDNQEIVLDFQELELRMSPAAIRSIVDALPPDDLH